MNTLIIELEEKQVVALLAAILISGRDDPNRDWARRNVIEIFDEEKRIAIIEARDILAKASA